MSRITFRRCGWCGTTATVQSIAASHVHPIVSGIEDPLNQCPVCAGPLETLPYSAELRSAGRCQRCRCLLRDRQLHIYCSPCQAELRICRPDSSMPPGETREAHAEADA